jgi:ADP-dependent phosphofructokinase/glucokinase
MPTIEFDVTDAEASAILSVTGESAQAFLERNARAHVADCVLKTKERQLESAGLPRALASVGLDDDEVAAVLSVRSEKVAKRKTEDVKISEDAVDEETLKIIDGSIRIE